MEGAVPICSAPASLFLRFQMDLAGNRAPVCALFLIDFQQHLISATPANIGKYIPF
jgi:hypothetical protein